MEDLWERLVRAALRRERTGTDAYGQPATGIAGNVPSSLAKNRDIDAILRAADEIQDDDPNVSRICTPFSAPPLPPFNFCLLCGLLSSFAILQHFLFALFLAVNIDCFDSTGMYHISVCLGIRFIEYEDNKYG